MNTLHNLEERIDKPADNINKVVTKVNAAVTTLHKMIKKC